MSSVVSSSSSFDKQIELIQSTTFTIEEIVIISSVVVEVVWHWFFWKENYSRQSSFFFYQNDEAVALSMKRSVFQLCVVFNVHHVVVIVVNKQTKVEADRLILF